ncbi:MAG: sulfatase [Acidobacteria bacterium]|nr:sulfatase [Acidobacteriota bacterium]
MSTVSRRSLLGTLLGGTLFAQPRRRPNFVLILADDLGYGDIGCYGSPDVPTPHLDSLARDGVRCTDAYVSCAVCSPSRVALLTGRYQHRYGHEFNSGPISREAEVNFGLPKEAVLLPALLKPAGYRSACIGKWHLGARPGYHPLERGFDEFYGFLGGGNDFVTTRTPGARAVAADGAGPRIPERRQDPIRRGFDPVPEDRYLTSAFGAEAVDFIERNHGSPFFLYLAFNAIHTPLHATDAYLQRFAAIPNEKHRMLAAMTAAMDDAIGAVLAKLRERGLERDTLVVFLSDNGCPVMTGAGTNGPLNGEKVTYYDGGIRVPLLTRWTGILPPGITYKYPIVSRDLVPTFLKAAAIPPPAAAFDGIDLLPYFTGRRTGAPHEYLFWRGGKGRAVRSGPWKLVEFGDSYSKLYHLGRDIGEKEDLSAAEPGVVRRLRRAWTAWSNSMRAPAWPARQRNVTVNGTTLTWDL